MEQTIEELKAILDAERFILTGSYVLSLFGLIEEDKVNDLDIILVNPTEEAKNILKRLMRDFPAKTKPYPGSGPEYIFLFRGGKIDIFIESSFKESIIQLPHFQITTIPWIIKAKKSYKRMKDWVSMRDMSRIIFKPDEFESFLNNYSANNKKRELSIKGGCEVQAKPKKKAKLVALTVCDKDEED